MPKLNTYCYTGPVMEFDRCVQDNWSEETSAPSEAKARSNLVYRWKKRNGREPTARITLPGKIRKAS